MEYKAIRAFQNNGPDYWIIYQGIATFGADPVARCDKEEQALALVNALNHMPELLSSLKEIALVEGSVSITQGTMSFEDGSTLDLCMLIDAAEAKG